MTFLAGVTELLLFAFASIQLVRVIRSSAETGLKLQAKKVFHGIIASVMLVRGVFLVLVPFFVETSLSIPLGVFIIWNHGAELLFCIAYFMLLMFWVDFYLHMARGRDVNFFHQSRHYFRVVFAVVLLVFSLYACLILFWAGFKGKHWQRRNVLDTAGLAVLTIIIIVIGLAFLFIGLQLYLLLMNYAVPSHHTITRARKVGIVATAITVCFLARAIVGLFALFNAKRQNADQKGWDVGWVFVTLFFFGTEVIPTVLILFLLRNLPKGQEMAASSATPPVKRRFTAYSPLINQPINSNP